MTLGDFDTGTVVYFKFATYNPSTGAPFTLAGTPAISVYKDNSVTQSTTGVTLTVDFDAVTGLHHVAVDTSADGTFYAAGSFFDVVITTGTVNAVSAVGTVVGRFTLRKTSALKPTTAGRTLDVSAGGEAGIDWANVGSPTTVVGLSGTTIKTATDVETDTADIQTRLPAALVSGRIDASVGAMAANVMTAAAAAADLTTELQSGLATDALLTTVAGYLDTEIAAIKAKTDNLPASPANEATLTTIAGYLDTEIAAIKTKTDQLTFTAANKIDANMLAISGSATAADNLEAGGLGLVTGTCSTGSTTTSIVTNLTEATDDHYNGRVITFTSGALAGQTTSISDYNGTTKTLTVVALTEAAADTDAFVIS
jgi:cell division protein ZapA (FtsZ GTPase activity inhibitor)